MIKGDKIFASAINIGYYERVIYPSLMENSTSSAGQLAINSLVVDKKIQEYRDSKELHYFWDIFSDCISGARIDKEL